MKTVWNFLLPFEDEVRVEMPAFSQVLSVANQGEELMMWAYVDPRMPSLPTTFRIAGTGHPMMDDDRWNFIDTVLFRDGTLVLHVFQLDPKCEVPPKGK